MSNLYSKKGHAQFKGPLTSDVPNKRNEALYMDLVYQYNKIGLVEEDVIRAYQRLLKDHFSLTQVLYDLEKRIAALETEKASIVFSNSTQDDTARFVGTAYEIASSTKCYQDLKHGMLVLPKIDSGSISKVCFYDNNNTSVVPGSLDASIVPDLTSADNLAATIDQSAVENAFLNRPGAIWERNVVTSYSDPDGASLTLYVKIPDELSTTANSNAIMVHPHPIMGCDLLGIYYSTKTDIVLSDTDAYVPVNKNSLHTSDQEAIGWSPPGGWAGDTITSCGPKIFYFDPQPVTAVKLVLRQKNYFTDSGRYVYTYGLSSLDVRNDKFSDTGKIIMRYDAPSNVTINNINSVTPQIWNVSEAETPYVFSYRVIWETSFNSGVYTLNPVSFSKRVWIEVTLNSTSGNGTPALSGLALIGDFVVSTDGNSLDGDIDGGSL